MADFMIKDCFVCNFCREICGGGCNDEILRLHAGIVDDRNRDLADNRKQIIKCLGKYCDSPCCLQDMDSTVDTQVLVNTIKYLGTKLNSVLVDGK